MAHEANGARDFPYYDGRPVDLSPGGWLVVLAFTAAGFTALMQLPHLWPSRLGGWSAIALFVAAPLVGLRLAAGSAWRAIFRRPTARDLWIGVAFAPLTLLVSATVALAVMHVSLTAANPAAGLLTKLKGLNLAAFIASTAPQLLGEELVTIMPFLAILTLMRRGLKTSRPVAVAVALIVSSLIFGALHLATYQWRVGQALLIIGSARLVLTVPYLLTKNVWTSFITHLTHDWTIFALVIGLTAAQNAG